MHKTKKVSMPSELNALPGGIDNAPANRIHECSAFPLLPYGLAPTTRMFMA
jgi:hypothetical protein